MLTDEQITEGSSEPSEPAAFARIREVLEYFDCKTVLVSESESEWLYYIIDTLRKGQANLLMRSCTEAM
jgi:hypothetical protein